MAKLMFFSLPHSVKGRTLDTKYTSSFYIIHIVKSIILHFITSLFIFFPPLLATKPLSALLPDLAGLQKSYVFCFLFREKGFYSIISSVFCFFFLINSAYIAKSSRIIFLNKATSLMYLIRGTASA